MSIVTIFTKKSPTIAGFEFDAVLEDTLSLETRYTEYPIESGAIASDYGIISPFRWRLIGAVSNNPLRPTITDFTGALTNLASDSGAVGAVGGFSAGLLSGSNDTRASETLQFLISLQAKREPFDIDAGDIELSNMVITRLTRTKDIGNEGGLIFEAELQELPLLETLTSSTQPKQSQLRAGDPSASQAAATVDRGEVSLGSVDGPTQSLVSQVA